jgi:hypothetical protein
MTKAFDEKYHKDRLVDYVLSSWLTGYEMDYDSWMDNNGNPIMIIHFSQNEKSIVIKREDFNKIILPEVEKKFNEYKKGFYDNTRS